MILKILVFIVVIAIIYLVFFKKSRGVIDKKQDKSNDAESLVECSKCATFVPLKEAYIKDGKYYCSKECMLKA